MIFKLLQTNSNETRYFIKQLKELVKIKSLADNPQGNKEVIDYIESILPKNAKKIRNERNGVYTLIAGNNNLKKPDIAYLAHADVVSGSPEQFSLKLNGDKLIGRGVSDMKYAIPIGIALLEKVITEKLNINFVLVITTDEEVGGANGIQFLSANKEFKPKIVIVPDWGDNFVFTNKSKGVAMIQIDSVGKKAHASEIWKGKDANRSLCELATKLLQKYGKNNMKKTWETTMNIGVMQGGIASNQVCDSAFMKLDFRFPEARSATEIFREVKEVAKKIDLKLSIKLMVSASPTQTDINSPCRQVTGQVAQSKSAPLRTMQKTQGLDQRSQRHGLVELKCFDRTPAQALFGRDVLKDRKSGTQLGNPGL